MIEILNFILVFVEYFLILNLFEIIITKNSKNLNIIIIYSLLGGITAFVSSLFSLEHIIATFLPVIIMCYFGYVILNESFSKSLMYSVLIVINTMLVNVTFLLLGTISNISPHSFVFGDVSFSTYIYIFFSKLILLFQYLYFRNTSNNFVVFDKKSGKWIIFITLSCILIIIITTFEYIFNFFTFISLLLVISIIIIILFLVYYLCYTLSITHLENIETKLQLETAKYENTLGVELNKSVEQYAKIQHDHKKHLSTLRYYIATNESLDVIDDYLNNLDIEEIDAFNTSNNVLNYILGTKSAEAKEKGVNISSIIMGTNTDYVTDFDYSSIVGNLLDNAIEGCVLYGKDAFIQVQLNFQKDEYCKLQITNTSLPIQLDKKGNIITNKVDTTKHGYGMKTILDVVEKYHGEDEYYYEDGFFTHTCILFNVKKYE